MFNLDKDKPRFKVDTRVQPRNLKSGSLTSTEMQKTLDDLPASDNVVAMGGAQPALGSFDAERLAKVQQTFERYTKQNIYID